MSSKRPADAPDPPAAKKPRVGGFRVPAPANLPDGPWRRKAVKIKQELIVKSKIKKEYARVKAKQADQPTPKSRDLALGGEAVVATTIGEAEEDDRDKAAYEAAQGPTPRAAREGAGKESEGKETEVAGPEIHPDRVAMLDEDEKPFEEEDVNGFRSRPELKAREERDRRRRAGKPGYFEKELEMAERKRKEEEERAAERERRDKEREKAIKERERHRRIMAKARSGGRDGRRKLGRESVVMLDRVKRLVGQK